MDLVGQDLKLALVVFEKLHIDLGTALVGEKRYWELVGQMQELAHLGLPKAKSFMAKIDITKAPTSFGEQTTFRQIREGPRGTSVKGVRRQLQADPNSPNKTFGMRPNNSRGDRTDET